MGCVSVHASDYNEVPNVRQCRFPQMRIHLVHLQPHNYVMYKV